MKGIELSEKNVRLHVSARDWEEAVRIGGRILVENGTAKESYVEGIVNSIKEYGPYVVISKGFAIPHTRAEDGSLGIGFSLITLREPVYFDPKDDPVEVMICFSAIDSQTHLDILKMIVTFVEKGYVEKIAKLDTIDELNALLQNEESGRNGTPVKIGGKYENFNGMRLRSGKQLCLSDDSGNRASGAWCQCLAGSL